MQRSHKFSIMLSSILREIQFSGNSIFLIVVEALPVTIVVYFIFYLLLCITYQCDSSQLVAISHTSLARGCEIVNGALCNGYPGKIVLPRWDKRKIPIGTVSRNMNQDIQMRGTCSDLKQIYTYINVFI